MPFEFFHAKSELPRLIGMHGFKFSQTERLIYMLNLNELDFFKDLISFFMIYDQCFNEL